MVCTAERLQMNPATKYLGNAPRLGDAAARRVRSISVENLADRADAGIVEVRHETFERRARGVEVIRVHLQPCIDEGADQPSPDGALVIRGVARAQIAVIS